MKGLKSNIGNIIEINYRCGKIDLANWSYGQSRRAAPAAAGGFESGFAGGDVVPTTVEVAH